MFEFHLISVFNFSEHDKSMFDLRKLLSKGSKIKRNRRLLLNLQISCIAWATELIGGLVGALIVFLPFENVSSRARQIVTDFVYFVILPTIYLTNSDENKSLILQNGMYLRINDLFFNQWVHKIVPENEDAEADKEIQNICEGCGDEIKLFRDQLHKQTCTPFKNFPQFDMFL